MNWQGSFAWLHPISTFQIKLRWMRRLEWTKPSSLISLCLVCAPVINWSSFYTSQIPFGGDVFKAPGGSVSICFRSSQCIQSNIRTFVEYAIHCSKLGLYKYVLEFIVQDKNVNILFVLYVLDVWFTLWKTGVWKHTCIYTSIFYVHVHVLAQNIN